MLKPMHIAGIVVLVLAFLWWRNRNASAAPALTSYVGPPAPAGGYSGASRVQATQTARASSYVDPATVPVTISAKERAEILAHPEARSGRGAF